MRPVFPLYFLFSLLLSPLGAAEGEKKLVTVLPAETNEILANPGMGWETFHFPSQRDKNLPSWIPSTVHYVRWAWKEVEPQAGKLNAELLDDSLQESHASGQKLAFRIMCCAPHLNETYHPEWLKEVGGKILLCDRDGEGPFPIPDLDDPIVLEKHLDLIARLGKRYDGHPDLDHVDLGSIGWWGEWHLSGSKMCKITRLENRQKVVNAYLAAFKKTPLLMLIGGGGCLASAAQHGAGSRADCLGDLGGFSKSWNHMWQGYPEEIKESRIQEAWKTAPVAWETCWDIRKWVEEGWPLRYIFNYALALHGSYINNKSAPLPEGENVQSEVERFLRRLGYRLVLKELKHPARATTGETVEIAMKWQNAGSAPCYRPYRLAYRLTRGKSDKGSSKVIVSKITVNGWLPGSVPLFTNEFFKNPPDLPLGKVVSVTDSFSLPEDLPVGNYTLAVAVVGENEKPVVQLGIKGRTADGWYPLSTMQVVK